MANYLKQELDALMDFHRYLDYVDKVEFKKLECTIPSLCKFRPRKYTLNLSLTNTLKDYIESKIEQVKQQIDKL